MLESLFKYSAILARHKNAPLLEERDRYLEYPVQSGYACQRASPDLSAFEYVLGIAGNGSANQNVSREVGKTAVSPRSRIFPEMVS